MNGRDEPLYRRLKEIRESSPFSTSEEAYAQMEAAMEASRKANRMDLSPATFAKLGEIRANSPERSSEAAYAQMDAARAASRAVGEPHPYEGDGPECALCLRGRGARRHGVAGGWR